MKRIINLPEHKLNTFFFFYIGARYFSIASNFYIFLPQEKLYLLKSFRFVLLYDIFGGSNI